jgi:tetratricopeptide (TPR) repeat protein
VPRFAYRTSHLIYRLALVFLLCSINLGHAASEGKLNYQQARKALSHAEPQQRINGMKQLLKLGTAKDASLVYALLNDTEPAVRQVALGTVWQLWGKSGNAAIDKLYQKGLDHMQDGDMPNAIQVFSAIIAKRPEFAEAWNKRATVYYMSGEYDLSMEDCQEVLKRLPQHFGALAGYAQMLAERGVPERALELMERASKVNPYLANAELMMAALRIQIETKRKNTI